MALKIRKYRDSDREEVGLKCEDPSRTVQASKEECDINVIVAKYNRTGELPGIRQIVYADISEMPNLREAIHMVNAADQAFMELPAEVRRFFDNDPTKLVDFASNPANLEQAVKLGLANPKAVIPEPVAPVKEPPKEVPPPVT